MDMDMDMGMESIDTEHEGAARSWRDILLTLALASSAAIFFFARQRRGSTSGAAPRAASLNDEERRRRRERLAAMAEERAALQAATTNMGHAASGGVPSEGGDTSVANDNISVAPKKRTDPPKTVTVSGKDSPEGGKDDGTNVAGGEANNKIQSVYDCGEEYPNGENVVEEDVTGAINDRQISVDEVKDEDKQSQCDNETNLDDTPVDDVHDNTSNHDVVEDRSSKDITGADEGLRTTNEHVENAQSSTANTNSTGDAERSPSAESDSGHRDRHAKAIAKIMAKKGKPFEKKTMAATDPTTLNIFLMLISSPPGGSPKLELSIPAKQLPASSLLRSASQASGVPEKELKLIFRGRIIAEYNSMMTTGHDVVEEYGIENGSVLHVVGKPRQSKKEDEGGNDSRGEDDIIDSGEEDSSESEGDDSSDSEEEDSSVSDDDAIDFSDSRARARIVAEIRRSSGNGIFHRAAQRGDLDALREAVDNGHSDLLRVADSNGWTPLHEAVRAGHVDIVEYLVREVAGIDVHEVTNQGDGWSLLSLALEHLGRDHPIFRILDPSAYNPWDDGEMYD